MADENEAMAPEAGTTNTPTNVQPQTDPAAPQGTTKQDDQQGTIADGGKKAEKEPLFQTKYQDLVGALKSQYGSLEAALQGPQQPQAQIEPEPDGSGQVEFDPYDPDSMKNYMDYNFRVMGKQVEKVVQTAVQKAREEERMQAQIQNEFERFNSWSAENQVPQEVINKAVQTYYQNFGTAGTPKAFVDTVQYYITQMSKQVSTDQQIGQKAKEAVDRAKELAGLENPQPGQPPNPSAPEQKSQEDVWRDNIAPDEPEPSYD